MAGMRQTPLTCSGHTRPVVHLAFSDITSYGYFLISACKDGKPMLRQGDTGDWIGTFVGHKGAVWGATLNKDATVAATGAADFTAKLWNAEKGEELHTFPHKHIVKCVDFSSDSSVLLTGCHDKNLRIFDISKPEQEPQVFSGHASNIRAALFMKNDKSFISISDDKSIRIWDTASNSEVKKIEIPSQPTSLELARDGTVFVVTYGNTTSFWNAQTFEKIKDFESHLPINSSSLHPSQPIFVSGGEDFKMYKFDFDTGAEIESFKGHFGPVHCVRFSPDGELYASGSEDGTLRLWQTQVGKTYGLWKCVNPEENGLSNSDPNISTVKVET
ncbi:serine-threonine kinase receptor-associated protein-like [Gigantopelta aegis]|uniref:serine-threonine kinase receptor-associated protein-like n=1 Tax=Gigantopelta aegis TaxID=1735272 RepID=UPI001B88874C|nr:serine-threonine kinase receptor-associated protein-like [Gigantopelta aegis]